MAQEIRATTYLNITKNGFTITGNTATVIDMSGSNYVGTVLTIPTTYIAVPTGSCGDVRYIFISNQSTGSIDVATNTASQSFAVLQRGDSLLLPPADTRPQYYIKSSLNNSDVQVVLTEK
jgi:hypothetical protein